ncbi:histidine phosphatase family protein [Celerinatantimonas sp. YJH-8]|uniref:histidine phosphatase family protein n=1 Tax=Celerinatantimonas sp. YJH-8 TaxID=3228714 RepID=UPI0038C5E040
MMTASTKPLELYLIRHGQTEWNVADKMQGWLDSPLTARGKSQLDRVCWPAFGAIYCSDLGRAMASARRIARRQKTLIIADARLRERYFGTLQGKAIPTTAHGALGCAYQQRDWLQLHALAQVEPEATLWARIQSWLGSARKRHRFDDRPIAVVTHGEWIHTFLQHYQPARQASRLFANGQTLALNFKE